MRILLLLASLLSTLPALDHGDPIPWISSKNVMPYGNFTDEEFHLEAYRGAPMFLAIWRENGGLKRGFQERIFRFEQEFAPQGALFISIATNREKSENFYKKVPQRSVVVFIEEEVMKQFDPVENNQRFLIVDGSGTIVSSQNENMQTKGMPRAFANTTPYGRWKATLKPHFKGRSTVKKAAALQEMVNDGKIGSALAKARKYKEGKDEALRNESIYIENTITKWITKVLEIEQAAIDAGDAYAAYMIGDDLANTLKGADEADAAKKRNKTYKDHEAYKTGKSFYQTWQKTWGQEPQKRKSSMLAFQKKHADSYYGKLIDTWYNK